MNRNNAPEVIDISGALFFCPKKRRSAGMDEARAKMIDDFYEIYRPLQKRYNLRMNSHFSIYERDEDYIEIYEYDGEMRGRRICFVKEDEEIDCYRKAMEALKSYKGKERL